MSSDTSSPTTAPVVAGGFTDFVANSRSTVAWVLVALGVACAITAVACFARSSSTPAAAKKDDADKTKDLTEADKPDIKLADPKRQQYFVGALIAVMGAVAGLGVGAAMLVSLPKPTLEGRRSDARKHILLAGGLYGLVLMFGSLLFFVAWFGSLLRWLEERKTSEAKWVLGPLLVFLLGAGLAFIAAQPARTEERNNPLLRRLVYGANFTLSTLLLLLVLVAGNVFAALKLPAKLDTTESGFYTLSDATKEYLAALSQPIIAYTTIPDRGTQYAVDCRRLLEACAAVNPQKFQVRPLDESLNKGEISSLQSKYQVDLKREAGILLTTEGENGRHVFIPGNDLITREADRTGGGGGVKTVFRGEAALAKEILGLTESKTRPVIYFTQSSGELAITPNPEGDARRNAEQIRSALEKGAADVRALPFGAGDNKVPDDAAVIVVADPLQTLPDRQVEAIKKYMATPRAEGKKGKLIVLTGAHAGPDGKQIATGLEPLLAEYQVRLGENFLYQYPLKQYDATTALVGVSQGLVNKRNTIAQAFAEGFMIMRNVRTVEVQRGGPPGKFTSDPLFLTGPRGRPSWVMPTRDTNPEKTVDDMIQSGNRELLQQRQFTESSRQIAAVVSEGETPRAVIIGSGEFFADTPNRKADGPGAPVELFSAAANWLRDRPAVANIANKTYGTYVANPNMETVRALWFPIALGTLGTAAAGFGVWMFRRA